MRNMYCIYDNKAESIVGGIILERADAPAIRAFHDALDPKNGTVLSQHPEDFELYLLGALGDSGTVIPNNGYKSVATGAQWAAMSTLTMETT